MTTNPAITTAVDAATLQAEANERQRRAADPAVPVWVGASAGSGKTRVLVNRLLRLMLPSKDRQATPPYKILCITFTRAGANEVMDRVVKVLRQWAVANLAVLEAELKDLLNEPAGEQLMKDARALFAKVIETPGGMKIMTIHAFCQSVLARFPLEAGLPAGFEVMVETEARDLMRAVRRNIITTLQAENPNRLLKAAFDDLSTARNAEQIESLMESAMAERGRLRVLLGHHGGIDGLCAAIDKTLNVDASADTHLLIHRFCADIPESALRDVMTRMAACHTRGNQGMADTLAAILAVADRAEVFEDYKSVFLTTTGTPRKLVGVLKDDAAAQALFARETERLRVLDAQLRDIATARATQSLFRFCTAALESYEAEKRRRNRLDFEDLIDRTRALLSNGGVNWVQYKLDGGIDHILVDEAQDTNPDQWDIITALYDEFYAGEGLREAMPRTTFVVGDEKQSIFSFQRADPRVFGRQHARLEKLTALRSIPMRISFRSAPSILAMVDAVFAPPHMRQGVMQDAGQPMEHFARQTGKAGYVELWPLIQKPEKAERNAWDIIQATHTAENPVVQMADRIAATIRRMLDDPGQMLESKGRRIRPGDIMVLLSRRKPLAEAILKSLRRENIPVSGIDRMVVTRQLAVRDVLAACNFVLQPDDDLNLASLLKSPLVGLDDDALFALAHARGPRALWLAVRDAGGPVAAWLSGLFSIDGTVAHFLHTLLYTPCPADAHSGMRALLARLGEDVRDPLQELLARADAYDLHEVRGLQGFVHDALRDDSQIKRDLQESDNRVRLMTVHGSKGLEAPIVFLPDTIRARASRMLRDPILWPEREDTGGIPLWTRDSAQAADLYRQRADTVKQRGDEEQRRLLYVALTRAADRLYIGGMQKFRDQDMDRDNSWYFPCRDALERIGVEDGENLTLSNPQTDPVKPDAEIHAAKREIPPAPWLFETAPAPESPPRPLMPSKPEMDDPAVMSPLFGDISHRYRRGRIIHKLFQLLPELDAGQRLPRAIEWLASPAHNLTVPEQNEILEATFNVLDDPAFETLFDPRTRAEVPLTGHLRKPDGTHAIVSGQIDRLVVTDGEVIVLDYKTNRPAPKTVEEVPDAYRRQMRTYRDILAEIWPNRPIRCALLWTDGPALMDLTDTL